MKGLAGLVVLLPLLAGCGTETGSPVPRTDPTPVAKPSAVPVPPGPVRTAFMVTVLDDGDGAELCLGGVDLSLPPQCGGPKLVGWNWSEHEGAYEERSGTRWGSFGVVGTFDGTDFHPTEVTPGEDYEEAPYDDPYLDSLETPCDEPEGGWRVLDPALTTWRTQDDVFRVARRLEGYAGGWVDQSINPAFDSDDPVVAEQQMNDPTKLVVNVQVTGDLEAAEERLREVWGGALCVSLAEHTEKELLRIQEAVLGLPGVLGGGASHGRVVTDLVYDDGSIQAWLDQEYGAGLVHLTSQLVDAS